MQMQVQTGAEADAVLDEDGNASVDEFDYVNAYGYLQMQMMRQM